MRVLGLEDRKIHVVASLTNPSPITNPSPSPRTTPSPDPAFQQAKAGIRATGGNPVIPPSKADIPEASSARVVTPSPDQEAAKTSPRTGPTGLAVGPWKSKVGLGAHRPGTTAAAPFTQSPPNKNDGVPTAHSQVIVSASAVKESDDEEIPWDERQELLQGGKLAPDISGGNNQTITASDILEATSGDLALAETSKMGQVETKRQDEQKLKEMEEQKPKEMEEQIIEENKEEISEAVGHRPKEDYTKPPPNFKVASARRKHGRPKATINQEDPVGPELSAEPKGKRLPGSAPPPPKTEGPKDCDGVGPNDTIYRLKPPPVDTPGIKYGELPMEKQLDLMKQQVATVEQVKMLGEPRQETKARTSKEVRDRSKRIIWPTEIGKKSVSFEDLGTRRPPSSAKRPIRSRGTSHLDGRPLINEDEQYYNNPRLSLWTSIREALQEGSPHRNTREVTPSNGAKPIVCAPQTASGRRIHIEEDSHPFDEVRGTGTKRLLATNNMFPPPTTISAIHSQSSDRFSASGLATLSNFDPFERGGQPDQNIFRSRRIHVDDMPDEFSREEEEEEEGGSVVMEERAIKELELEKARLEAHLMRLIVTKGFDGAVKEQQDEIDRWRKILQSSSVLTW